MKKAVSLILIVLFVLVLFQFSVVDNAKSESTVCWTCLVVGNSANCLASYHGYTNCGQTVPNKCNLSEVECNVD